jgi:predicted aconitase with swiveling domain
MIEQHCKVRTLIGGDVEGNILILEEPISFWGGVDTQSGNIIDCNHPQCGDCIRDTLLVLPGTRGSTASPGALLEMLAADIGPKGFILTAEDSVCLVAASMCTALGRRSPSVVEIPQTQIPTWQNGELWRIENHQLFLLATTTR